jgi:hypothetical protein
VVLGAAGQDADLVGQVLGGEGRIGLERPAHGGARLVEPAELAEGVGEGDPA